MSNVVAFGIIVVLGVGLVAWLILREREEQQSRQNYSYDESNNYDSSDARRRRQQHSSTYEDYSGHYNTSNPYNNHDHLKKRHLTRESAEQEKRRMQSLGLSGSERLNVYKNEELGGWFVGRSKW